MDAFLKRLIDAPIERLPTDQALSAAATLIDLSHEGGIAAGLDRAEQVLTELGTRTLAAADEILVHYFQANLLAARRAIAQPDPWAWEDACLEAQILALRKAVNHDEFPKLDPVRQCQILTNLAGCLDTIGRFIEALEVWDRALRIIPTFAMALGNRGVGLSHYARSLYDSGHVGIFALEAHDSLARSAEEGAVIDSAAVEDADAYFTRHREEIAGYFPLDEIRSDFKPERGSLGRSRLERDYRSWCLANRLFLNPLNDVVQAPIAAHDVLTLPSISTSDPGMPVVIGFFNQLKQEYVSARYALFEGLQADKPHFSDRWVLQYNTFDYPSLSRATELLRLGYRAAYSLFDKIAYFINSYWSVGHKPTQVSFRSVWYEVKGKPPKPLLTQFSLLQNWPLRGLFWLSKDIFEEQARQALEPEARDLADLRNHLEHKYLQLHEGWAWRAEHAHKLELSSDGLRISLSRDDFAEKAMLVMKKARAALIYLSLAVEQEERRRGQKASPGLVGEMTLSTWEDRWKF
ncbi:MAG TPA: LA2681 family HEPN domain-containing protein [Allosphingosinicella sp.]|nr:LA2681 family HEPN domain-containing protein [Allosphingosinicella sp.]